MPSRTVDPAGRAADAPRRSPDDDWEAYRRTRAPAAREALFRRYQPLVHRIADRVRARLPPHVELDELITRGSVALLNALDAFDPGRGIKFETFSRNRIRGAMIDELRRMNWAPRGPREHDARFERACQQIQMKTGWPATREQITASLGLDSERLKSFDRDRRPPTISSIARGDGQSRDTRDLEIPAPGTDPRQDLHRKLVLELVTKHLTPAEQVLVILYYYEGLTMKEIGRALGHSESRISQIHKSILQRLRIRLRDHEPELEPIQ